MTLQELQVLFPSATAETWHQHPNGHGWVENTASVADTAYVGPEAQVYDEAQVFGQARVYGHAWVYGQAQVFGYARVYDQAQVYDEARVYCYAQVYDQARVFGHARVYDEAWVYGLARVYGQARVYGHDWVYGQAQVYSEVTTTETETQPFRNGDHVNQSQTIWAKITARFEGIHWYPGAPLDVAFLAHPHRHLFYVTVWIEQFHDDRDVEFIRFKRQLQDWCKALEAPTWSPTVADTDENCGSCEMMARRLWGIIALEYPDRRLKVEVSEDGENGAVLE